MSVLDFEIEFQDSPPLKPQIKNLLRVFLAQFLYRAGLRFKQQDHLCHDISLQEIESLLAEVRSSLLGSLEENQKEHFENKKKQNNLSLANLQKMDDARLHSLADSLVCHFNRILLEDNFNPATSLYQKPLAKIEEILCTRDVHFKKSVEWRRFDKYISQIN